MYALRARTAACAGSRDLAPPPTNTRARRNRRQEEARAQAASGAPPPPPPPGGGDGLTDLERQIVGWYRNTFLVAGAALVGSVWHWHYGGGKAALEVFVPPRAASLPAEVVEGWARSMRFKEGVRAVGRQTLFATGAAAAAAAAAGGGGGARPLRGGRPGGARATGRRRGRAPRAPPARARGASR